MNQLAAIFANETDEHSLTESVETPFVGNQNNNYCCKFLFLNTINLLKTLLPTYYPTYFFLSHYNIVNKL